MKRLFLFAAITGMLLTMVSISWASANLNLSKSNINIVVYSADGMTSTQAAALVRELDKTPRVDEAAVTKALQRLSIPTTNFKLIRIIPGKPTKVLLLTDPTREAEAKRIAINDPGMPPERPIKSK